MFFKNAKFSALKFWNCPIKAGKKKYAKKRKKTLLDTDEKLIRMKNIAGVFSL